MDDKELMLEALREAEKAAALGEVPVGALVVRDGVIVSRAYNTRESDKNALCHAEIKAIDAACRALGGWRLPGCTLYVTLEPCPMCTGAVINAHMERVVYGAKDSKAGALGTKADLNEFGFGYRPEVVPGVLEEECSRILSDFFRDLREKKKKVVSGG